MYLTMPSQLNFFNLFILSLAMNIDSRMLTPGFLLSIIYKRVFFERKLGSSVSSAANPGYGSPTQRVCMRWAHLPLSKSY